MHFDSVSDAEALADGLYGSNRTTKLTRTVQKLSKNLPSDQGRRTIAPSPLNTPLAQSLALRVLLCVMQIIDLLVRLLQCALHGATDQTHLTRVFRGAYDVLYTYMIGNSRKNALYFAKYIDFFQTQITVKAVQYFFTT